MPSKDHSSLLELDQTYSSLEWWEHTFATTDATWARKEQLMEPERLRSRSYHAANDQRAVVELLLTAQAAEPAFDWPGAGQLRTLLAAPELDIARDVRLWVDAHGALVAFAALWAGRFLVWFTRPSASSDALAELILGWAERRAREQAMPGAVITLRTEARSPEARRIAALTRLGFVAESGGSLRMTRCLDIEIASSDTPSGYRIRPLAAGELEEYLTLARRLFPNANRLPLTEGRRRALMVDASYTPALDLVVEAANGALVGLCHTALRPDERERLGRRAGWIELIGVAPEHQRGGLGRALLRAGMLTLADHGANRVYLTVRADNARAQSLYAAEGFTNSFEECAYVLTLV